MFKTIVAITSIASATDKCSSADKGFFANPDTPSMDLILSCLPMISGDYPANCFSGFSGTWILSGHLMNVGTACANCLYDLMSTTLADGTHTVNDCLSATDHLINSVDCAPEVDSAILSGCTVGWATTVAPTDAPTTKAPTEPSGNGALSMASSMAVAGAMIVATWSA